MIDFDELMQWLSDRANTIDYTKAAKGIAKAAKKLWQLIYFGLFMAFNFVNHLIHKVPKEPLKEVKAVVVEDTVNVWNKFFGSKYGKEINWRFGGIFTGIVCLIALLTPGIAEKQRGTDTVKNFGAILLIAVVVFLSYLLVNFVFLYVYNHQEDERFDRLSSMVSNLGKYARYEVTGRSDMAELIGDEIAPLVPEITLPMANISVPMASIKERIGGAVVTVAAATEHVVKAIDERKNNKSVRYDWSEDEEDCVELDFGIPA